MRRMSVSFTYRWLRPSVRLLIGSTPGRKAGTGSCIITRLLSSRPVMPVGAFGRVAGVGKGGFLLMAAGWLVGIGVGREAPETAVVPDRRGEKDQDSQKVPDFWSRNRLVLMRIAWLSPLSITFSRPP